MKNIFNAGLKIKSKDKHVKFYNINYIGFTLLLFSVIPLILKMYIISVIMICTALLILYLTNASLYIITNISKYRSNIIDIFISDMLYMEKKYGEINGYKRVKSNIDTSINFGMESFIYHVVYKYSTNRRNIYQYKCITFRNLPAVENGECYKCKNAFVFMKAYSKNVDKVRSDSNYIDICLKLDSSYGYEL